MFPFAMIESQNAMAHEVRSALPSAPMVAPAAPLLSARGAGFRQVRAVRTVRAALAASLHRAADAVAPAATCSPAR